MLKLLSTIILATFLINISYGQSIVVYGDSRTNHDDHKKMVSRILEKKPDAVFHTGDLVENGMISSQWEKFLEITEKLRKNTAFYPVTGNHEMGDGKVQKYFDLPGKESYYSVVIKGVKIIILNSCISISKNSNQYIWLENELMNRDTTIMFTIAMMHHSPYSTGKHREDENNLRNKIIPLFENYKVDIVFSGHDHHYERSKVNDIYYIVSGGGGAPLYEQSRKSSFSQVFLSKHHFCHLNIVDGNLVVDVLDSDLVKIDHFVLTL